MLCYLYRSIIHIEGQWNVILRQMEADDMIPASPQFWLVFPHSDGEKKNKK